MREEEVSFMVDKEKRRRLIGRFGQMEERGCLLYLTLGQLQWC